MGWWLWLLVLVARVATFSSLNGIVGSEVRGSAHTPFRYDTPANYGDGMSLIRTAPNERNISLKVFSALPGATYNDLQVAFVNAAWGQLIAHDLVRTEDSVEDYFVDVAHDDEFMNPTAAVNHSINLRRTSFVDGVTTARRAVNHATSWLDASTVYGTSAARAAKLRMFSRGKLKFDPVNGLPRNPEGHRLDGPVPALQQRLNGDGRGCVNPGLLALQGIFVLEHNRLCDELLLASPDLRDEELFQAARMRVIAIQQMITYNEYVPVLLGEALPAYTGFNASLDGSISIFFAIASYRYGHSGVNSVYFRTEKDGSPCGAGPILLRDAYFNPSYLEDCDIASIMRGMMSQPEEEIDMHMSNDLRHYLLGLKLDLAAIDIMRGRDVGLPTYSQARAHFGLSVPTSFADVTPDVRVQVALAEVYDSVDDVDAWVGGLAENHKKGSMLGELFHTSIKREMLRLRSADMFWYENYFGEADLASLRGTTLCDVIARNLDIDTVPASGCLRLLQPGGGVFPGGRTGGSASVDGSGGIAVSSALDFSSSISGDIVEVTLTLSTTSTSCFAALGLGAGMADADMLVAQAIDGRVEVSDHESKSTVEPAQDSQGDWDVISSSLSDGKMIVIVQRALDTGDSQDHVIEVGEMDVIFAWSTSSSLGYHGSSRAHMSVDFATGLAESKPAPLSRVFVSHGVAMIIALLVILPTAVGVVRFLKNKNFWMSFHRAAMVVTLTVMAPSALTAFVSAPSGNTKAKIAHRWIGLTVTLLMCGQVLLGNVSKHMHHSNAVPAYFLKVMLSHKFLGLGVFVSGVANCILGAYLLYTPLVILPILLSVFWLAVFAVLQYRKTRKLKARIFDEDVWDANRQRQLGVKEFERQCNYGMRWVLYENMIIDVTDILDVHPGGRFLIHHFLGRDIANFFRGHATLHGMNHGHSRAAFTMLTTNCVGMLGNVQEDNFTSKAEITSSKKLRKSSFVAKKNTSITLTLLSSTVIIAEDLETSECSEVTDGTGATTGRGSRVIHLSFQIPPHAIGVWNSGFLGKDFLLTDAANNSRPYSALFAFKYNNPTWQLQEAFVSQCVAAPMSWGGLGDSEVPMEPVPIQRGISVTQVSSGGTDRKASGTQVSSGGTDRKTSDGASMTKGVSVQNSLGTISTPRHASASTAAPMLHEVADVDMTVDFIVKVYRKGKMSNYLANLHTGDTVRAQGPYGVGLGIYGGTKGLFVALCQGTGIVPFLDLVHLIGSNDPAVSGLSIVLICCFKSAGSIIGHEYLLQMNKTEPRVTVHFMLRKAFNAHLPYHNVELNAQFYNSLGLKDVYQVAICGSSSFELRLYDDLTENTTLSRMRIKRL